MASGVRPEEVYIGILVHFFVHPPPVELLRVSDRRLITRQLAVFLLKELKDPDNVAYPTLHQLYAKLQSQLGELGASLSHCLDVTLRNLRCTHDIFRLFGMLEKLLVRSTDVRAQNPLGGEVVAGLDPLSPLGLFIRKLRVAFLGMSFEAVARLQIDVMADVAAAAASLGAAASAASTSSAAAGPSATATGGAGGGRSGGGGALRDRAALEVYVARLLQRIEQEGPSMPQSELDAELAPLEGGAAGRLGSGSGPGACPGPGPGSAGEEHLPLSRLVRLQAALQHRDYTAALDLMHSYYNCNVPGGAGRSRNAAGLLSLSTLQTSLGHTAEALQALSETMRTAQQASDPAVLLHALGLLCRLLASTSPGAPGLPPHGPAALRSSSAHHVQLLRMLRRCAERGRELAQPQLTAFAQLAAARFALMHDVEPSDAGLHAPPGSLTAATGAAAAATPPGTGRGAAATGAATGVGAGAGGWSEASVTGDLRSPPIMVACALKSTLALATNASLSAAAPVAPPPPAPADGATPPQRAAGAADLYPTPLLFDRSMPAGAAAAIADSVQQMAGAAHLLQSSAWGVHGHDTLERAHTMVFLAAFADPRVGCGSAARFEDRGTACAQLLAAAARSGPAAAAAAAAACLRLLSSKASTAAAQATGTATAPAGAAEGGPAAGSGHGARGLDGDGADSADMASRLALYGGPALAAAWLCAAHDRALAVGDLAGAGRLVGQLAALADPEPHRDVELRLEAARRGALNLLAAGDTSGAHEAATELFARCADAGLQLPALRCLLLLAEIHLAAGDPHGALPHALACLLPAQPGPGPGGPPVGGAVAAGSAGAAAAAAVPEAGGGGGGGGNGRSYDLLAAEALLLVCRCWHELSDGQQLEEGLAMLQDALPLVLAHGSVHLQARAQLTLAEMVLSEAHSPSDLSHCAPQLARLLRGAAAAAAAAEDFRLGALAACLLAWLHAGQGAEAERDAAAALHEEMLARQGEREASGCGAACDGSGRWLREAAVRVC